MPAKFPFKLLLGCFLHFLVLLLLHLFGLEKDPRITKVSIN